MVLMVLSLFISPSQQYSTSVSRKRKCSLCNPVLHWAKNLGNACHRCRCFKIATRIFCPTLTTVSKNGGCFPHSSPRMRRRTYKTNWQAFLGDTSAKWRRSRTNYYFQTLLRRRSSSLSCITLMQTGHIFLLQTTNDTWKMVSHMSTLQHKKTKYCCAHCCFYAVPLVLFYCRGLPWLM